MTTFFLCANFVHEQLPRCISSFKPGARWSYVNSLRIEAWTPRRQEWPKRWARQRVQGPGRDLGRALCEQWYEHRPRSVPRVDRYRTNRPERWRHGASWRDAVDLVQSRSRGARSPAGARALRALVGARLDQRYWPPRRPSRRIPARLFLTTTSSWFVWAPPEYSSPCAG
jgi:hypothetical protein